MKNKSKKDTQKLYELITDAKLKFGDKAIDLISQHFNLEIKYDGATIKSCCPHHNESTPSYTWDAEQCHFHCFGCGKNYGIFDYLLETKGSFKKALKELFVISETFYEIEDDEEQDFFEDYLFPPEETNTNRDKVNEYCSKRGISEKTLDALGIKQDKNGNVVFELRDIDNRLLSIKYRLSRPIKQNEDIPKMWWWQKKDENGKSFRSVAPSLFNINKIDVTKPLVITEGYFDALACYEAGYQNVTSIHGSAKDTKWIQFNFNILDQFEEIVLWFDNDKAGQEGLQETINRLGEYRCKVVKPSKDYEDMVNKYYKSFSSSLDINKTDANNILLACGANALIALINNAKEIPNKRLKYLMDVEPTNVKDMEKISTGIKAVDDILYGTLVPCFTIYSGYAGCVDKDTEFFNGKYWKKISEYNKGDKVLQYHKDGRATLVEPKEYHKYESDTLYHFKDDLGINQCLSDEHNVFYIENKELKNKKFKDIKSEYFLKNKVFDGEFITTFEYGDVGVDFSDEKILEKFDDILNDKRDFNFLTMKHFQKCNNNQFKLICNKVKEFKELNNLKVITTTNINLAEFIQFAFSSCGYNCIIRSKEEYYEIDFLESNLVSLNSNAIFEEYETLDGYKYCFTTETGMWIMRRNGCISITGNSGKSSLANLACLIAPVEEDYKVFVYSGELDNGQLADWIFSPLAGYNHILQFENETSARPSYCVSNEALKRIKENYRKNFILHDNEDGLETSEDIILEDMEIAYKRYGCKVFLIDNLMTISFMNVSEETKWEAQKSFIKKLMAFSKKYNASVNLIVHPKKPASGITSTPSIYDLHGASEIGNLCHRMLWVRKLDDDEAGFNTEVIVVKDRPSQSSGKSCKLYYDYATRRIYTNDEELKKVYSWENKFVINYAEHIEEKLIKNKMNKPKIECTQF